jgi:hypothetical protein
MWPRRFSAMVMLHAWHLATSVEAVDRGLAMRSSDKIYSPDIEEQYQ